MRTIIILLLTTFMMTDVMGQSRRSGMAWTTRSEVIAQNGMVCSSHPLATQVGIDILKRGGSAVDAAIAVNACLGLMEPTGCGVGGDLFAIVWDTQTQQLYGLNASGRSPKSLTLDYLLTQGLEKVPTYGALSVSVPGCVDGWFQLHGKFGRLLMKEILQPAIDYALYGFPVTEVIGSSLNIGINRLSHYPNVVETYNPIGRAWEKGDIYTNSLLAKTLQLIADKGRDEFYKGSIALAIADFMKSQGGFLSYDDFVSHTSDWIDPVTTNYRGYDVWELPPNGQGIAVLQMLNILEHYDLKSFGFGSPEHIHYFVEAKKLAFEDRAKYYADLDFVDVPVQTLISKEYGVARQQMISNLRASTNPQAGLIANTDNTIYLTVADKEGNMVSLIQSNYQGLGSGMVPTGLGFMLQDRGELFSLKAGQANTYAPGKRPFHTIIPAFITKDGKPYLSFGVMGGDFQPLGHVQIIMNMIDFGMNPQEAGDAPRINHIGSSTPTGMAQEQNGGSIVLENGFPPETVHKLLDMGHKVSYGFGSSYGGYQGILYDTLRKIYFGASESRKDGCAMGY